MVTYRFAIKNQRNLGRLVRAVFSCKRLCCWYHIFMENAENNLHKKPEPNWDELADYPDQEKPFPFENRFKTKEELEQEEEENLSKAA